MIIRWINFNHPELQIADDLASATLNHSSTNVIVPCEGHPLAAMLLNLVRSQLLAAIM